MVAHCYSASKSSSSSGTPAYRILTDFAPGKGALTEIAKNGWREILEPSIVSAVAAVAGATIGGLAGGVTSWLTSGKEVRADWVARQRIHRQDLYAEFINPPRDAMATRCGTTSRMFLLWSSFTRRSAGYACCLRRISSKARNKQCKRFSIPIRSRARHSRSCRQWCIARCSTFEVVPETWTGS